MAGVIKAGFLDTVVSQTFNNAEGLTLHLSADADPLVPNEVITELASGNGYSTAGASLAAWTVTGGDATHGDTVFTAAGGAFISPVYGYFIKQGTTVLCAEVDPSGPYTITDGDTYTIDLSIV